MPPGRKEFRACTERRETRVEGAPRVGFTRGGFPRRCKQSGSVGENVGSTRSKAPDVNPTCGAPKCVFPLGVRATYPKTRVALTLRSTILNNAEAAKQNK